MPNHITNIIKFEGDMEQIREMLERIQNEQFGIGTIDFNKIIPMPESLNMEAGSRTGRGLRQYREFLAECLVGGMSESDESLYLSKHPEIDPEEWRLGKTKINFSRGGNFFQKVSSPPPSFKNFYPNELDEVYCKSNKKSAQTLLIYPV